MCAADSEVLRTLDLSWNHIRRKGAVAIAAGLKVMAAWNENELVLNCTDDAQLGQDGYVVWVNRKCGTTDHRF